MKRITLVMVFVLLLMLYGCSTDDKLNDTDNQLVFADDVYDSEYLKLESIPSYKFTKIDFNPDKVCETFIGYRKVTNKKNSEDDSVSKTSFKFDDGSSLIIKKGSIIFDTTLRKKHEYYYALGETNDFLSNNVKKKFPKDELVGFAKNDAITIANKVLSELEIEKIVSEPIILTMDTETMLSVEEKEQPVTRNGEPLEKWTNEADAYCFIYSLEFNDIKVSQVGYIGDNLVFSEPSYILMIIGKDGIIGIQMYNLFDVEVNNEKDIISLNEVISIIEKEYDKLIMIYKTEITSINILYLPSITNSGELVPVWIAYGVEHQDDNNYSKISFVIDAYSGEILSTDGIQG